ncbi:M61 family metallopeptidase [Marinoscillum pacificum]|uniref:M61 family metallopeptidase n=1 Tax=Marinoscillum pacificum TaxID=392723 RepID=UPI00215779ED|nr:M61 family peptidase [Marinoscillum pacificum]
MNRFFLLFTILINSLYAFSQNSIHYSISVPSPKTNSYEVSMAIKGIESDTITLKMPQWHPGYYQIMSYGKDVKNLNLVTGKKSTAQVEQANFNTWNIFGITSGEITVKYQIQTHREFVANSYVDKNRAYIIPENTFLYIPGKLNISPTVEIDLPEIWSSIATGLQKTSSKTYQAEDYDILYDSPILLGNLESLPAFEVGGKKHQFIGYNIGEFDKELFNSRLKDVVQTASDLIGDIPYEEYTFIGIGAGRGGIEHLNNTTVSFDGNQLKTEKDYNRVLNFLAHEYYHHYNVKRIRPFELGPFDYENGNRTHMLWVSEGLSVYYEYIITKRAGIANDEMFLSNLSHDITELENNPGKNYQSLAESSFYTWRDGPMGTSGSDPEKAISYYIKGPVVGLLLDLAIRNATENEKSLDDVMRLAYFRFYKDKNRGFTDSEFNSLCEEVAGAALTEIFEYVYTTKALNYDKYLSYGGLKLEKSESSEKTIYQLTIDNNASDRQKEILNGIVGE